MRKKVTIMIGIPGSGKSTLARMLHGSIVSADHFHTDDEGQYHYRYELAGQAHLWCLERFIRLLERGDDHVIVDNTNTRNFERAPYVQMARLYGYVVEFMKMTADPNEAHMRCVHGLTLEQIKAMHARMEELPSHWPAAREGTRILEARLGSSEPVDAVLLEDALRKAYNNADPKPQTEAEFVQMIDKVLDPGVIWQIDSFTPTGMNLRVFGPFCGSPKLRGSVAASVRIARHQDGLFISDWSQDLPDFDPTLGLDTPALIVNGQTRHPRFHRCFYSTLVKSVGLDPEQRPIVSWTSLESKRCGILRPGCYLDTCFDVIVEVDLDSALPLPSSSTPPPPPQDEPSRTDSNGVIRNVQFFANQLWVKKDDGSFWSVEAPMDHKEVVLCSIEGDEPKTLSIESCRAEFAPAPGHKLIDLGEGAGVIQIMPTRERIGGKRIGGNHVVAFFVDPPAPESYFEMRDRKGFLQQLDRFGRERGPAPLVCASFRTTPDMSFEIRKRLKATAVSCVLEKIADMQTTCFQISKAKVDLTPEAIRSLMLTV